MQTRCIPRPQVDRRIEVLKRQQREVTLQETFRWNNRGLIERVDRIDEALADVAAQAET